MLRKRKFDELTERTKSKTLSLTRDAVSVMTHHRVPEVTHLEWVQNSNNTFQKVARLSMLPARWQPSAPSSTSALCVVACLALPAALRRTFVTSGVLKDSGHSDVTRVPNGQRNFSVACIAARTMLLRSKIQSSEFSTRIQSMVHFSFGSVRKFRLWSPHLFYAFSPATLVVLLKGRAFGDISSPTLCLISLCAPLSSPSSCTSWGILHARGSTLHFLILASQCFRRATHAHVYSVPKKKARNIEWSEKSSGSTQQVEIAF